MEGFKTTPTTIKGHLIIPHLNLPYMSNGRLKGGHCQERMLNQGEANLASRGLGFKVANRMVVSDLAITEKNS